jgi:hypothetical protein
VKDAKELFEHTPEHVRKLEKESRRQLRKKQREEFWKRRQLLEQINKPT